MQLTSTWMFHKLHRASRYFGVSVVSGRQMVRERLIKRSKNNSQEAKELLENIDAINGSLRKNSLHTINTISRSIFGKRCGFTSVIFSLSIILIATLNPVSLWTANLTLPIEPLQING